MITTIRRRRRSLPLPAFHRPIILVALRIWLALQHRCPHHAAHAFMFGSPAAPSFTYLAALHHPSAFWSSRGSEAGCCRASRLPHQNGITSTTIFLTANMDASFSEEGLQYDTGSDSTFRDDGMSENVNVDNEPQQGTSTYRKTRMKKPSSTVVPPNSKKVAGAGRGKFNTKWEARFILLKEFRKEHGHCRVPRNYSVDDDVKLGKWVNTQRTQYKNFLAGKYSPMTQERIDQLNSVGFEWGTANTGWEGHFQKLVQFKDLHGHCRVPQNYSVDDVKLGKWVTKQRQHYQKYLAGKSSPMTQERIDALTKVGFHWGKSQVGWEANFEKLVQFKESHGHCQVPSNYSVDGVKLGTWVHRQRQRYRNNLTGRNSPMSQEQIDQLNSVGFNWSIAGIRWEGHFEKLVQFKELHGHCQVPSNYSADDVNLGTWVHNQRQRYRQYLAGKYSPMTQERIDQLNSVGFDWGTANTGWEGHFQKLVQFKESHGHCRVPYNHSVDDVKLGIWVMDQRQCYRKNLKGRNSPMSQERIDQLNSVGFDWGAASIGWEGHFEKLVQFKESHGHCRVPRNHSVDDVRLGMWVNNQRREYKNFMDGQYSLMTEERIDALEYIGFEWNLRPGRKAASNS